MATAMEVKVSVIDTDLFEEVISIMKDVYEFSPFLSRKENFNALSPT